MTGDLVPQNGLDLSTREGVREASELLMPELRGMVIITFSRPLPVDLTLDWLRQVLPEAPWKQIEEAALVVVTNPTARLAKVIKNTAGPDEYLEIHTASIG